MKRKIYFRTGFVGFTCLLATLLFAGAALAQEMPSQVNLQLSGIVPKDSVGNGITDHVSKSGGLEINYTYHLNSWAALEGGYGYGRNTHSFSGDFGTSGIQTNMHEVTGAFVLTMPVHIAKVRPYALAGTGLLRFDPTSDAGNAVGSVTQNKGAFLYGAGLDFNVMRHIGLRADYRGFVSKAPDFSVPGLTTDATTHFAQPSVGIFFRF